MTNPRPLLARLEDHNSRTYWLEVVIVAHVTLNAGALNHWDELTLSPTCAALLDVLDGRPARPALVALKLADVIGDIDVDLDCLELLRTMAANADDLTVAELAAVGTLETVVTWLHAERLELKKAA
jgi:hypothetical protein